MKDGYSGDGGAVATGDDDTKDSLSATVETLHAENRKLKLDLSRIKTDRNKLLAGRLRLETERARIFREGGVPPSPRGEGSTTCSVQ